MLTKDRVDKLLENFQGKHIIVLGDVMLDEFVWGKVRRISPEAPVPVVDVTEQTYRLGGAGNVAANVRALGGNPIAIGLVGKDSAGDRLLSLLQQLGVESTGIIRSDLAT